MAGWNPILAPENRILFTSGKQALLSPGLCAVYGLSMQRDWEENRPYGLEGGFLRYRGRKLIRFNVTFRLYTEIHWAEWDAIRPMLCTPPTRLDEAAVGDAIVPVRAIGLQHSLINGFGISAVVVEAVTNPEPSNETGEWVVTVNLIEYRVPKQAKVDVKGADLAPYDPKEARNEALDGANARLRKARDQAGQDALDEAGFQGSPR